MHVNSHEVLIEDEDLETEDKSKENLKNDKINFTIPV